jgi:hypothetical protein
VVDELVRFYAATMLARPVPVSLVLTLAAVAACGGKVVLDSSGTTGAGGTAGAGGSPSTSSSTSSSSSSSTSSSSTSSSGSSDGTCDGGCAAGDTCQNGACVSACAGDLPPPVGWWQGADNMLDSSGDDNNGSSGTLNGATPVGYAPGEVGTAFALDGTSYVDVPNAPSLDITGPVTMAAWIFADATPGRIIDKITAGGTDGYMLDTYPDRLRIIIGVNVLEANVPLPLGEWIHAAGTWDGATANLYMNGALVGSSSAPGPLPNNTNDLRLGGDTNGHNLFDGLIDDAILYDVALSAAQMQEIYAAGSAGMCSGN